jgi:hypothetical protein
MAIPNKATGAGNLHAVANVFKITFDQALSTAPKYEAWDNTQAFPAKDASGATTAKEIFTGTAGNSSLPYLYLVDTNAGATASASDWKPVAATGGSANPNRLKGTTSYVTATNTPALGEFITFNIGAEVPYDAAVPSDSSCNFLLQIRYTYTGTAPSLTYTFNEGSEATPSWTTLVPGTNGIRFCNTGTVGGGPYKLTLPAASTVDAAEVWVTV